MPLLQNITLQVYKSLDFLEKHQHQQVTLQREFASLSPPLSPLNLNSPTKACGKFGEG